MTKCKEIMQAIEAIAPPELAESWDNIGLLVGDSERTVERAFICLDVTQNAVNEAVEFGANLIIAHHPLIFAPQKRVIEQNITGKIISMLIKNDISVFAAHTNFDSAPNGLADILANKLELKNSRPFTTDECLDELGNPTDKFGRVSRCESTTLAEFAKFVKERLNVAAIKYAGDSNRKIETVATCPGGGADMLYPAFRAGADVLVTADVKHHIAQLASELGIAVIDAGHFETEVLMCDFMKEFLNKNFPAIKVEISKAGSFFKTV